MYNIAAPILHNIGIGLKIKSFSYPPQDIVSILINLFGLPKLVLASKQHYKKNETSYYIE